MPAGTPVIARSDNGPAHATVEVLPQAVLARRPASSEPARATRRASPADITQRLRQAHRERDARQYAMGRIRAYGLEMKLSRVEHLFDGSKLIVYFTAESRVDFRDLVRDLAAQFRMRIEMRQIGVRDEAKMLGGYGSCGRPLCCTTWLNTFEPVSIKMAKRQDLSLNPSKLSGLCGRLKCCLRYELPNSKGVLRGGCGEEGGCKNPSGCGTSGSGGDTSSSSGCGAGCSCK
jgi:cell fate regulator YaaT (PSP1 superfamily)